MALTKTIYIPTAWEAAIQSAFKNTCFLNVLGQKDTIDFKNEATFPRYKTLLSYKVIKQSRS